MKIKAVCCLLTCLMNISVFADEQVIVGAESTAEQYLPKALSLDVSTVGVGGSVLWNVHPSVNVIARYSRGRIHWRHTVDANLSNSKNNRLWYLNAMIQPWAMQSNPILKSFYVSSGFAYMNQSNDLLLNSDGKTVGQLEYKNTFAPYIGLGLYSVWGVHWGGLVEVGTYYLDHPSIKTEGASEAQQLKWVSDQSNEWQPMAKLSVIYRF